MVAVAHADHPRFGIDRKDRLTDSAEQLMPPRGVAFLCWQVFPMKPASRRVIRMLPINAIGTERVQISRPVGSRFSNQYGV